MRDNIGRLWGVIEALAVDILPEKSYIDWCYQYILSMERRIVLVQSKPMKLFT